MVVEIVVRYQTLSDWKRFQPKEKIEIYHVLNLQCPCVLPKKFRSNISCFSRVKVYLKRFSPWTHWESESAYSAHRPLAEWDTPMLLLLLLFVTLTWPNAQISVISTTAIYDQCLHFRSVNTYMQCEKIFSSIFAYNIFYRNWCWCKDGRRPIYRARFFGKKKRQSTSIWNEIVIIWCLHQGLF